MGLFKSRKVMLSWVWTGPSTSSQHLAHTGSVWVMGHIQRHATAFLVPYQDAE